MASIITDCISEKMETQKHTVSELHLKKEYGIIGGVFAENILTERSVRSGESIEVVNKEAKDA